MAVASRWLQRLTAYVGDTEAEEMRQRGRVLLAALVHEALEGVRGRRFPAFVLFMAAGLTGLFLAGDVFNFYVFFEVAMVSAYALATYGGQPRQARAAAARGVALQLSGHTHGGMIIGLDRLVARGNAGFVSGRYELGGMTLYVSNGTGLWPGFALRLGIPSEITRIILRPM